MYLPPARDVGAFVARHLAEERRKGCDPSVCAAPVSLEPPFCPIVREELLRVSKRRQRHRRPSRPLDEVRQVRFARTYSGPGKLFDGILLDLVSLKGPFSIELVSKDRTASLQVAYSRRDRGLVERTTSRIAGLSLVNEGDQLFAPAFFIDLCPDASAGATLSNLSPASLLENLLRAM